MPAELVVLTVLARGAAWLLTYLLHSTLILGAVWLLARRRVGGDAGTNVLWKIGALGGIVTATVQLALGAAAVRVELPAPTPELRTVKHAELVVRHGGGQPPEMRRWTERRTQPATAGGPGALAAGLLFGGWIVAAGAAAAGFALERRRLLRGLAERSEVAEPRLREGAARLLSSAGVRRSVRVTACEALATPAALGPREVCLPARVLRELSADEQAAIVAHELAHVVRRDPLWLTLLLLVRRVFFVQPLNRLALQGYRETAELLCDEWAVRATGRPVALARSLTRVAGWLAASPSPAAVPAMLEGGTPFVRRIERLVQAPRAPGRAWPALLAGAVVLAVAVACVPAVLARPARPLPEDLPVREVHRFVRMVDSLPAAASSASGDSARR